MTRNRLFLLSICLAALAAGRLDAQNASIQVTNPSHQHRLNEPVVLGWDVIAGTFSGIDEKRLRLVDEANRSIPFQIDDLDGDGSRDEMAFLATMAPAESRTFLLTAERDSLASPVGPPLTDAVNYKRVEGKKMSLLDDAGPGTLRADNLYPFDGVGWESMVIAYRLYLDERNAMDIQGKRDGVLVWDFIGRTGTNYQLDASWGMDVLHVGPAFGFGGFGIMDDGKAVKPEVLSGRRTHIVARGPVRAVVRIEYSGWKVGNRAVDLTSTLLIYATDRVTEHRIASSADIIVATGIAKHASASVTSRVEDGYIYTMGDQSRAGDGLFMLISFAPETGARAFESESDHGIVFPVAPGSATTIRLSAIWEDEGILRLDEKTIEQEVARVRERISHPLEAKIQ